MIRAIADHICTEGFGKYDASTNSCQGVKTDTLDFAHAIGGVLRLSIHDAVTYSTDGTGGPDGCLDYTDPDNGGLDKVVFSKSNPLTLYTLNELYGRFSSVSSRADFWAVAANVAVMIGGGPDIAQRSGASCSSKPCVSIRWGRVDAATCASDKGRFPSTQLAHQHILDVFKTRLGFVEKEIVALMGAHTVGRTRLSEAQIGFTRADINHYEMGFDFTSRWDNSPAVFDNGYFQFMTQIPWNTLTHNTFEDGTTTFSPSTFQWGDKWRHGLLMLNTDMALLWDVTTVSAATVGTSSACSNKLGNHGMPLFSQGCAKNAAFTDTQTGVPFVFTFAGSQAAWFEQWVTAWAKMQELGWSSGKKGSLYPITSAVCV
jgi:catalase (peroxidase I)